MEIAMAGFVPAIALPFRSRVVELRVLCSPASAPPPTAKCSISQRRVTRECKRLSSRYSGRFQFNLTDGPRSQPSQAGSILMAGG